jgi:hypothetical protein
MWRKYLGTIYTQNDFDTWRAHYGQTGGSGSAALGASTNVPEPNSIMLLMGLALAAIATPLRGPRSAR